MAQSPKKAFDPRIEARVSEEEKRILQKAADILHLSLSDFVRIEVIPRAEEVIKKKEELRLNKKDSEAFVQALLSMPKKASNQFKKGAKKYKEAKSKGLINSP